MLRVLLLHRDLVFHGGVPRVMLGYARHCNRQQVQVRIGTMKSPSPEMVAAFGELGIIPTELGDGGYLQAMSRLRKNLRQEPVDLIVCNSLKSYLLAKGAAVGLGIAVVFWIHAIHRFMEGSIRPALFRWLVRRDPILAVSNAAMAAHRPTNHQGLHQIIYNGVEDPMPNPQHVPYPREYRKELGLPDDAIVFGFTAEFIDWKDHATLLKAFDALAAENPRVHLLLTGAGELSDEMKSKAAAMACHDRIHFLGARKDARRLLGVMDAYVHPSRGEAFGLAVVEAMLAGLPVVVSNEGAFVEIIQPDQTGLLFPAGNETALKQAMHRLANDPALARQLGDAARAYCLTHFSPDAFAKAVTEVFQTITNGSAREDQSATVATHTTS